MLTRLLLERRVPILKTPLTLLAFLTLGLGLLQLIPLPASLARKLSPTAHEIYSLGVIPELARADLPSVDLGEPAHIRSPATLDRAATLRWLFGALGCLGVFWTVSHFADRLRRLYLIWGCVLAAFLLNGALGLVQIAGGVDGLYGFLRPGAAPVWAPSLSDLLDSPSSSSLRRVSDLSLTPGSKATQLACRRSGRARVDGDHDGKHRRVPRFRLTRSTAWFGDRVCTCSHHAAAAKVFRLA